MFCTTNIIECVLCVLAVRSDIQIMIYSVPLIIDKRGLGLTIFYFRFPYFNISSPVFGYFQPDHSGYINPRRLVEAQLGLAQSSGCTVIR